MTAEDRKAYYDLCYEAQRSGYNPDQISVDDYDYCRSRGFCADEVSICDVGCKEKDHDF